MHCDLYRVEEVKIHLLDRRPIGQVSFMVVWKAATRLSIRHIHEDPAIWLVCPA